MTMTMTITSTITITITIPYYTRTSISGRGRILEVLIPPKVAAALPLLMKPLFEKVVQTAFKKLKGGSSPGKDGNTS